MISRTSFSPCRSCKQAAPRIVPPTVGKDLVNDKVLTSFFFSFFFFSLLVSLPPLFFFVFIFVNVLFLSSKMSIKRIKETIPPKHCEWKRCSRCSWKHCRQPFFKTFQEMFQNLILEDWPSRRHFLKCLKRHFAKTFPKTFPSFGVGWSILPDLLTCCCHSLIMRRPSTQSQEGRTREAQSCPDWEVRLKVLWFPIFFQKTPFLPFHFILKLF